MGDHSVFVLDQNHGRETRPDRGWCNMGEYLIGRKIESDTEDNKVE
jgi:hypothetical protein